MHGKNRLYRQKYNVQSCRAYTPLSRLREACIRYLQHGLKIETDLLKGEQWGQVY